MGTISRLLVMQVSLTGYSLFQSLLPASAAAQYAHVQVKKHTVVHATTIHSEVRHPITLREYMHDHPKVRAATIGAGVGTAAGALTGLVTRGGIMRGALIGAGSGAGIGLIRTSTTLKRHPIMQDVATGSVAGLGLGWAASNRYRHVTAGGTAVGAAAGLAVGMFKNL